MHRQYSEGSMHFYWHAVMMQVQEWQPHFLLGIVHAWPSVQLAALTCLLCSDAHARAPHRNWPHPGTEEEQIVGQQGSN